MNDLVCNVLRNTVSTVRAKGGHRLVDRTIVIQYCKYGDISRLGTTRGVSIEFCLNVVNEVHCVQFLILLSLASHEDARCRRLSVFEAEKIHRYLEIYP